MKSNEYYTPKIFIDSVTNVFGCRIDLDPFSNCLANKIVRANNYYTEYNSAFDHKIWDGKNCFMNPPYSKDLFPKAVNEFLNQHIYHNIKEAIVLTNANYETKAGNELAYFADAICLPIGRINFYTPSGETNNNDKVNIFYYFGGNTDRFCEVFSKHGNCFKNYNNGIDSEQKKQKHFQGKLF